MSSTVRHNLMKEPGYSPYCGNRYCRGLWPRTTWTGKQFRCHACAWVSEFPDDFIAEYKAKWNIGATDRATAPSSEEKSS